VNDLTVAEFYNRSAWPVGTRVKHPTIPALAGVIVKRGGRIWVNRETLPWVRWDGSIDAVQVPWDQLTRTTGGEAQ
jgi:hypothetical protein